jgi:hypothetical protein
MARKGKKRADEENMTGRAANRTLEVHRKVDVFRATNWG